MPNYYPVMLDVRGRKAIVIGGDRVAAQKAAALTASGADVSVISQQFCDELLQQAEHRRVSLVRKAYAPGDLAGAFVVIAATNDPHMIQAIWDETQERGQLVNIVDVPERCTFIMPSVLRRDQLTIAVSTEGASPSLAKRIRQRLEDYFPPAYGTYMRLAALARTHMRQHGVSYEKRDDFFEDYFTSPILSLLSENNMKQATIYTAALLRRYAVVVAAEELEADLAQTVEGVDDAL
ncbi:MAG TPA: bifunctional precorrin-2 dehydrogenase/sirohydrochlorin ferrochelatase [Ktedonobacteraceae bacterium]|nr:bifunctional precorrin-2 dehydrogenase/sirohydrochlorin ferrochelatase [Ktedonobacteraceae bacterium]